MWGKMGESGLPDLNI